MSFLSPFNLNHSSSLVRTSLFELNYRKPSDRTNQELKCIRSNNDKSMFINRKYWIIGWWRHAWMGRRQTVWTRWLQDTKNHAPGSRQQPLRSARKQRSVLLYTHQPNKPSDAWVLHLTLWFHDFPVSWLGSMTFPFPGCSLWPC